MADYFLKMAHYFAKWQLFKKKWPTILVKRADYFVQKCPTFAWSPVLRTETVMFTIYVLFASTILLLLALCMKKKVDGVSLKYSKVDPSNSVVFLRVFLHAFVFSRFISSAAELWL